MNKIQKGCAEMNDLKVRFQRSGDTLVAFLEGEIDHHSVRAVREEIDRELSEQKIKMLTLDFENVGFMDSSGLGLVMGRYNRVRASGASLEIRNPSARIARVFHMAGVDKLGCAITSELQLKN